MNIYDFDDTIYDGDTSTDLVKWGLRKHPIITLKSLLKAYKLNKEYKKGKIPFERVKEVLLSFIFKTKDTNEFIKSFVKKHMKNIKPWYKDIQTENDIIATASYEIWINAFAKELGIKYVIGTKVDENGNIIGKNCKREEKVVRLKEAFPKAEFNNSYSDSSVDIPILELSKKAYVVEGNNLIPYKKGYKFKNNK